MPSNVPFVPCHEMREGRGGRRVRDREIDAAGQHHQRLTSRDHRQRRGHQKRRRDLVPRHERLADLVAVDDLGDGEERDEDEDQDDDRVVREEALGLAQAARLLAGLGHGRHRCVFLLRSPPITTTRMIRSPW